MAAIRKGTLVEATTRVRSEVTMEEFRYLHRTNDPPKPPPPDPVGTPGPVRTAPTRGNANV